MKRNSGLTLLELMVVVVIWGMLVSISLPKLTNMVQSSYAPEAIQGLRLIHESLQRCLIMKDFNDQNLKNLDLMTSVCYGSVPNPLVDNLDIQWPFQDWVGGGIKHTNFYSPESGSLGGFGYGGGGAFPAYRYCYYIRAFGINEIGYTGSRIVLQYCNIDGPDPSGSSRCIGGTDVCFDATKGGVTIAGDGVFQNIKMGPGTL